MFHVTVPRGREALQRQKLETASHTVRKQSGACHHSSAPVSIYTVRAGSQQGHGAASRGQVFSL